MRGVSATRTRRLPVHSATTSVLTLAVLSLSAEAQTPQTRKPRSLFGAVHAGDIAHVRKLLENGADPHDQTGSFAQFPIELAVRTDRLDIANLLVDHMKAPFVTTGGRPGVPVLFLVEEHVQLIDRLIEGGADINARDHGGNTIAHIAASKLVPLDVIVERGAEIDEPNRFEQRPLHVAAHRDALDVVRGLIARGASLTAKDKTGKTPLHIAAEAGHLDVVKALIDDHGMSVETEGELGLRPLHSAVFGDKIMIVRFLLGRGAKQVEATFGDPVILAARSGNQIMVEVLHEHGGDILGRRRNGRTPLCEAITHGHPHLVRWLILRGAKADQRINGLPSPCFARNVEILQMLLDRKVDVTAAADNGMTPLHSQAGYGRTDVMRLLLKHGAKIDAITARRETPLVHASKNGHIEAVELLLAEGADHGIRDIDGRTPLIAGAWLDKPDLVRILVGAGVGVNARDTKGNSALHEAARHGHAKMVTALLDHGCDRALRNHAGATARDIATRLGHASVLDALN